MRWLKAAAKMALVLASAVLAMRLIWPLVVMAVVTLVVRGRLPLAAVLLADAVVAPAVCLMTGGAVARLAAGTRTAPGLLGLAAAWTLAASVAVFPPAPWPAAARLLLQGVHPATQQAVASHGLGIHLPLWFLIATVYAPLAYIGDRLAHRVSRPRRK